jgi:hypothetical protein
MRINANDGYCKEFIDLGTSLHYIRWKLTLSLQSIRSWYFYLEFSYNKTMDIWYIIIVCIEFREDQESSIGLSRKFTTSI